MKHISDIQEEVYLKNRGHHGMLPWIICGLGAVFYAYEYYLRIAPSVMQSNLMHDFNLNATQYGNLSAFYYYSYVPMQLIVGLLMDRFGPRRLVTAACIICTIGTYLFASDLGLGVAQFGRFLVGFGSAFAFVGALKLTTIWLPPERFAQVSGLVVTLGMLGAIIGDATLTTLVEQQGWHSAMYLAAIIGLFLSIIIWLVVRDKTPHQEQLPARYHVIAFGHLLTGLLTSFRNPQMWLIGIVGGILYLPVSALAELWGIPYLKQVHGLSAYQASLSNSMIFLGWAVGGPVVGFISDSLRRRRFPLIIGGIGCAGTVACLVFAHALSATFIYVLLFLLGIFSSAQILVFALGRESSSERISGTAIAFTNMLVMLGGSIFQPLLGYLLDFNWKGDMLRGVKIYSVSAYQMTFASLLVTLVIAIFLTFFIKESHCRLHE